MSPSGRQVRTTEPDHHASLPTPVPRVGREGTSFLCWPCLLMCLPVMILAGGVGGLLVGATVLYAGARWGAASPDRLIQYGVPALVAAGGLLLFLVGTGVAETLVAGAAGGAR